MQNFGLILRNRPYMLFWFGVLVSRFGDSFTEFGLAWYILGRSQNPLDVGLSFLVFRLPGIFSGVLAGWLLDRFRRETIMLYDNLARGILVLLIPLLNGLSLLPLPLFYLMLALLGALGVITTVGSRTFITDFVPTEGYNAANSLEVVQSQLSFIVGPGLAGLLVALIGPLPLLYVDSCTFFFLIMILLLLLRQPRLRPSSGEPEKANNFWRQASEGIRYTFHSPVLLALLSISFFWNFGLGIFNVALPFFCEGPLGVGPAGMGFLLALNSTGVLLAALIFGPLRPLHPGRITCLLLIGQALCYVSIAVVAQFWLVLPLYFLLGMLDDLGAIYLASIRQRAAPPALQGRILAFTGTVGPSGTPLGNGLAGLILAGIGSAAVVALAGVPLLFVGGFWFIIGPIRQIKDSLNIKN